mmetsp:Transcript_17727/g.32006  ORF Transcript_17727/g.32006 Transcript_17727/m.32006 type:complete len:378 (-) Transcript_17727:24-1157(-)
MERRKSQSTACLPKSPALKQAVVKPKRVVKKPTKATIPKSKRTAVSPAARPMTPGIKPRPTKKRTMSSLQNSPEVSRIAWAEDDDKKPSSPENETFGADSIWAMLEESPQFKRVSEGSLEGCTTAQSSEVQTNTQASLEKNSTLRPFLSRRSPSGTKNRTSCTTPESGMVSPKEADYYKKLTVALKAEVEELKRNLNRATRYDQGAIAQAFNELEELRVKETDCQKALITQRESYEKQITQIKAASTLDLRQQEVILRAQLAKELEYKQKDSQTGQLKSLELLMKGKVAALKSDYERRLRKMQAHAEELESTLKRQYGAAQPDIMHTVEVLTSQLHASRQESARLREELARQTKRRTKAVVCSICRASSRLSEERAN